MRSSPYTVVSIHMPTIILLVTVGQPTQRKFYFSRASLWRGPHLPWYVIRYCEVRGSNPTNILAPQLSVDIQTKEHIISLHWRHNDHDGVSNHQPHGCLLNRLFRRRSKKTSKLCVTGLYVGNSPVPVNSPHKGPVTRKMFPFDDVFIFCYAVKKVTKSLINALAAVYWN